MAKTLAASYVSPEGARYSGKATLLQMKAASSGPEASKEALINSAKQAVSQHQGELLAVDVWKEPTIIGRDYYFDVYYKPLGLRASPILIAVAIIAILVALGIVIWLIWQTVQAIDYLARGPAGLALNLFAIALIGMVGIGVFGIYKYFRGRKPIRRRTYATAAKA